MSVLHRLHSALDLLRPRTFFRTLARVDALVDDNRKLRAAVAELELRTAQLTAVQRSNWEQREALDKLPRQLDPARVEAHVEAAIGEASIELDPFPHMVVTDWLPPEVYDLAIRALPPAVFFAGREVSRHRMKVPFDLAPAYSQRVWEFVANRVVSGPVERAVTRRFADVIRAYVREVCPTLSEELDVRLYASDGRIMLRRAGYVIEPHRDPKWGFLTGLAYLARPGDEEAYGTQFYRVADDEDAPSDRPYYMAPSRCTLVRSIPFRANSMVVFLNSRGAHGASIPADASPELERYAYQFRLGPRADVIALMLSHMGEAERRRWSGSKAGRAGY